MVDFAPVPGAPYQYDYNEIFRRIAVGEIPSERAVPTYRELCKRDLFFLLYFGLERTDINHPWVVARIREVEARHDDTLDLWAREHFKSTILTYALPIQELLNDPEARICIFSHTRPIAKGFLRQIKQTLEGSPPVKRWFPDVFWDTPKTQAPKWSEDDGLVVRRRSSAKEASIEAWGLVDGQPISKHYTVRVYDDVVTRDSVNSPEMIKKTLDAYELSQSLGTIDGTKRVVGTHYHFNDLYMTLRKSGHYHVRIYPATHDGTSHGRPVMLPQKRLDQLRRDQGEYVFSSQQLLNPVAEGNQGFKLEWIRYYRELPGALNRYLLVDPANEKKESSDYTVMAVIGIDAAENHYLLDLLRDKLNLTERKTALFAMWRRHPGILRTGYEKYGMQSDIAYMEEEQRREGTYFAITALGGRTSKTDRIRGLVPLFEHGRFYLPRHLYRAGRDLIAELIEDEYVPFPYGAHDDMLDCISRIRDADMAVHAPAATTDAAFLRARQAKRARNTVDGV